MKYGKYLKNQAAPEWKDDYIAYKALKRQIRTMERLRSGFDESIQKTPTEDTELLMKHSSEFANVEGKLQDEFMAMFRSEASKVEMFYKFQMKALTRQFERLRQRAANLMREKPYNRRESRSLEKDFVAFYRTLDILKNYATVNVIGFMKILKKFDHHLMRDDADLLFEEYIGNQDFSSSEGLPKLCHKTERLFAMVFEENNMRRAMSHLRKWHKIRTHWHSFGVGYASGASGVLLVLLLWLLFVPPSVISIPNYLANFVVFRLVGLLLILLFFWGGTVYLWKRNRVNYIYIFEFDSRTSLTYVEVYQMCLSFVTVYLACFVLYVGISKRILLPMDNPERVAVWIPCFLVVLAVGWVVLPFNFLWRSSRFYMIKTMIKVVFAPFTQVRFSVFYFADVLTSLAKPLCDVEFIFCFYFSGSFLLEVDDGRCNLWNEIVRPVVTVFPYWIRFLQCLRRFWDTKDAHPHLTNAGKYMSCCLYILIAAIHSALNGGESARWDWSRILWLVLIIWTTLYTYTWDVTVDWGFGSRKSRHFLLRDDLMFLSRTMYYWAIFTDFFLRCAWVLTVTPVDLVVKEDYVLFFLAGLEIFRRAQWGIFRLENAYVKGIDEYRSTQLIPVVVDRFNEKKPPDIPSLLVNDDRVDSPALGVVQFNVSVDATSEASSQVEQSSTVEIAEELAMDETAEGSARDPVEVSVPDGNMRDGQGDSL